MRVIQLAVVCVAVVTATGQVQAAPIVAPSVFSAAEAPNGTVGPLSGSSLTLQWVLPASDFSSITPGSEITSIGFRLDGGQLTSPASPVTFSQWNLQLSSSPNVFPIMDDTFANNIGPDVVTVRSGVLTIPVNAFQGGSGPNPFYDIPFATPYVYNGGALVATLRHTGHGGVASLLRLDADAVSNGNGNSVFSSFEATTGIADFVNFPVTQFQFQSASVPEPSSIALLATGAIGLIGYRRRKRKLAA